MDIEMHPYDASIEVVHEDPLNARQFTIRQGWSTDTFDSRGQIVSETRSDGDRLAPPLPHKNLVGDKQLGVPLGTFDHIVDVSEASSSTTTTTTRSPSTSRRRHQKRSSRQLLEEKLPSILRSNLPALDSPTVDDCPRPSNGYGGGGGRRGTPLMRPTSWITAVRVHERRLLEQRLALKNLIIIFFSELFGTFTFLFFGGAINTTCSLVRVYNGDVKTVDLQALQMSSLGYGFSLAISAWVFFRISGGVQNPAITLALTLTGALTWPKFVVLSVAQYIAGIVAAAMVDALLPNVVDLRTTLADGVSVSRGFWLEFIMSAQLIFTVLMLAAEKHRGTYLAPVGIGLALFITQLLGQPYTGASVNPARSLGPDVVSGKFNSYAWLYYVSSYTAAVVTSVFFLTLKWVRYETATPDQDADASETQRQLILDLDGNVVATMDTVPADEYDESQRPSPSNADKSTAAASEFPPTSSVPLPTPPAARLSGT